MSVTFINLFEVPLGADAEFLARWQEVNRYLRGKDGYLDHRLHRALADDARYRFVNVARWSWEQSWRDAHDDGFRALVADPAWATRFPSTPSLFEVAHSGTAAARPR